MAGLTTSIEWKAHAHNPGRVESSFIAQWLDIVEP